MSQANPTFENVNGIRPNPVKREVSRTFLDINGIIHPTYGAAYQASVKAKLVKIIHDARSEFMFEATSGEIADSIMKEMAVAWG